MQKHGGRLRQSPGSQSSGNQTQDSRPRTLDTRPANTLAKGRKMPIADSLPKALSKKWKELVSLMRAGQRFYPNEEIQYKVSSQIKTTNDVKTIVYLIVHDDSYHVLDTVCKTVPNLSMHNEKTRLLALEFVKELAKAWKNADIEQKHNIVRACYHLPMGIITDRRIIKIISEVLHSKDEYDQYLVRNAIYTLRRMAEYGNLKILGIVEAEIKKFLESDWLAQMKTNDILTYSVMTMECNAVLKQLEKTIETYQREIILKWKEYGLPVNSRDLAQDLKIWNKSIAQMVMLCKENDSIGITFLRGVSVAVRYASRTVLTETTIAINNMLHSDWFLYECEKNSPKFVELSELCADIMNQAKKREQTLNKQAEARERRAAAKG